MKSLEDLDASGNKIRCLPTNIGNLRNLILLDCKLNSLKRLPESICKLSNLEELNFHHNEIELIPNNIGELQNLRQIRIDVNNIRYIPESIADIPNLDSNNLWLNANNLVSLPEKLVARFGSEWANQNIKHQRTPWLYWFKAKILGVHTSEQEHNIMRDTAKRSCIKCC